MKLKRFTIQLAVAGLIAVPLAANAAGLGRLSVHSALGQPLAAEIELFAEDKAERDSLSANIASDQAFRDARVDFSPILSTLRFTVETRPDGRAVLKVVSTRPVTDPFIDMLVELNWASGRLVREYTMLLDPPGMTVPQTVAPVAVPAVPAQMAPQPAQGRAPAAPVVAQMPPPPASRPAPQPKAVAPDSVKAKKGDTLSLIASRVRPEGVSLEQTLVGLYRENPQAFLGNVNRLKTGSTLKVPSAGQVAAIPQAEAVRELKLQADDWRAYRQKLAGAASAAPEVKVDSGESVSGKITPKVEDRAKPAPDARKDVLKLSKVTSPAVANGKADETRALQEKLRAQEEDAVAREKALRESGERMAMLEKQIEDMQKLVAMKEKAQAEAKAAAPSPAPAVEKPKPAPAKAAVPVVKAPVASPESGEAWYAPLLANPLYWGAGLAALGLGGALWWMMAGGRRRKRSDATLEDSITTGSGIRHNTVIGAASGGSVNTGDTSFLTDFSQAGLGAIDTHDVDPIAEAEVYMAYGRDAQAEEILKEAIKKNPDRHEIRAKLLEIYAARHNTQAFETVAGELYAALGSGVSPLWDKACEMGRSIDPTNPLYGGVQSSAAPVATVGATDAVAGGAVTFAEEPETAEPEPLASLEFDHAPEPEPESIPEAKPVAEAAPADEPMDFALAFDTQAEAATPEIPALPESGGDEKTEEQGEEKNAFDLDFNLPDLDFPAVAPQAEAEPQAEDDLLKLDLGEAESPSPGNQFDFSSLDLELGDTDAGAELDEVGTKLDLARAYVEMGDKEGASEILNEVLAEGNEKQKADAQAMLNSLA